MPASDMRAIDCRPMESGGTPRLLAWVPGGERKAGGGGTSRGAPILCPCGKRGPPVRGLPVRAPLELCGAGASDPRLSTAMERPDTGVCAGSGSHRQTNGGRKKAIAIALHLDSSAPEVSCLFSPVCLTDQRFVFRQIHKTIYLSELRAYYFADFLGAEGRVL